MNQSLAQEILFIIIYLELSCCHERNVLYDHYYTFLLFRHQIVQIWVRIAVVGRNLDILIFDTRSSLCLLCGLPSCYTFFLLYLVFFSSTLFVFSTTHPIFNVIFCNINEVMKIALYAFQLLSSWFQFAFCFILSHVFFFSHSLIFFLETFSSKPFSFNAESVCLFKIRDYPSNNLCLFCGRRLSFKMEK